jgi:predicted hotdog family 3-hydroxylacyl-ACP dehydratase
MIEKDELLSLIPHRGKMLLLSRVKGYNLEELVIESEYDITEDCLFFDPAMGGVPSWVGFEFIAQTISAFSSIEDREMGRKAKFGFILSVSAMRAEIPFFKAGSTAQIKAKQISRLDSVFNYEGEITLEGRKVLETKITVMDVDDEQFQSLKKEYSIV